MTWSWSRSRSRRRPTCGRRAHLRGGAAIGAADFLVPAVSLRDDEVVVVKDNAYEPVEDESGKAFHLGEFIEIFLKGYPAVLVVDIDALEQGAAQYDALGDLRAGGPQVWWDAAARDHTDVINILTAGADRAVVSTRDLRSFEELEAAVELTENLLFQVVTRGRQAVASRGLSKAGTAGDLVARAARAGVEGVLLLDTARPLGGEVEWDFIAHAGAPAKSMYVGGGISASLVEAHAPPAGVKVDGLVVDLISVLGPYM